jgi:hypothetical protein
MFFFPHEHIHCCCVDCYHNYFESHVLIIVIKKFFT